MRAQERGSVPHRRAHGAVEAQRNAECLHNMERLSRGQEVATKEAGDEPERRRGITPIPPSNLTRVSSAPSGETMPMHNTDANSAFFIARLPPLTAALHET